MPLATGKYDLCELAQTFLNGMAWSSSFQYEIDFKVAKSEFILNYELLVVAGGLLIQLCLMLAKAM